MSAMTKQIAFGIFLGGVLIIGVLLGLIYLVPQLFQQAGGPTPSIPTPGAKEYTSNLIAFFQIYDRTNGQFITTDVSPEFYSTAENPFAYSFVGSPFAVGAYDSTEGAWKTVLDQGSYLLLVKDTSASPTKYPVLMTVNVPATSDDKRKTSLEPYMISMEQRASVTMSVSILAYNSATGAYDTSVSDINITTYDKWLTTLEINIAGTDQVIKAGRIYISKISGLIPEKAFLDGQQVAIVEDTDGSDDGMTGYYIEFPSDWKGGEIHRLDIYWKDVGASTGTLTFTLFDFYQALNPDLRWWTNPSTSVNVVS